ncbi:23S rRNA (uridine(2479)-2'-O)-methyltransferase [Austwickia sp. TVS 96-490-7B]|nr:23S rRNA (uridine(2479)-2'-O)-methyltransferase [Austwickia sp. TVS 96-490-7B]
MLTNPRSERVRSIGALSRRSARERSGLFLAEGPQVVQEALTHRPDVVKDLYVETSAAATPRWADLIAAAARHGVGVHLVDQRVLAAISDAQTPQGGVAVCRKVDVDVHTVLAAKPRLLCVLAQVRDPGNAGTVLRGADATGADAVILTDASVDLYNPKVVRSTVGSLFHLPVVIGVELLPLMEAMHAAGVVAYAADGRGPTQLHAANLDRPHAWIFGNEARGLPDQIRRSCDDVVRVPIYGRAESLNLAMAATVCLYGSAAAQHRHVGDSPIS